MVHRILGRSSGPIAGIEISGALSPEDYAALVGEVESLIADHGKTRLLWDLTGLETSDFEALWDRATFDVPHADRVRRIALVGPPEWHAWSERVVPPFRRAEVAHFASGETERAATWLSDGSRPD